MKFLNCLSFVFLNFLPFFFIIANISFHWSISHIMNIIINKVNEKSFPPPSAFTRHGNLPRHFAAISVERKKSSRFEFMVLGWWKSINLTLKNFRGDRKKEKFDLDFYFLWKLSSRLVFIKASRFKKKKEKSLTSSSVIQLHETLEKFTAIASM